MFTFLKQSTAINTTSNIDKVLTKPKGTRRFMNIITVEIIKQTAMVMAILGGVLLPYMQGALRDFWRCHFVHYASSLSSDSCRLWHFQT